MAMIKITKCRETLEMQLSLDHVNRTDAVMQQLQQFINDLLRHRGDTSQSELFDGQPTDNKVMEIDLKFDWAFGILIKNDFDKGTKQMTITAKRADTMASSDILLTIEDN